MTSAGPLAGLTQATGFLTVLGRGTAPTDRAMTWFPVVGAAVGGAVGLVWWGADEIWPPLLAAVVAVVVDVAITGALHHDGLADSADGLLPHMDRERRLAVMRQPDVGTFGVMALTATTLVRVGALAAIEPRPALLAGVVCASRTAMAVIARSLPYARTEGIVSAFLGGSSVVVALVGLAISVPLLLVASGLGGLAVLVAVGLGAAGVALLALRRVGGVTGDVLGAAGLLGESAGLLVAAVRW